MKRIVLLLNVLLVFQIAVMAQNKNNKMKDYDKEWAQVEKFEKDDLPKSALEVVDGIVAKALADKNTPQVIKALLVKSHFKVKIDTELSIDIFKDLESLLQSVESDVDKAVLHSLLAELYEMYFDEHQYKINRRTDLVNEVPENIEEWTTSIFAAKVKEHLALSVQNVDLLLKHTTSEYEPIVQAGADSPEFYPTLYDFLMKRAIDLSGKVPANWNERKSISGNSELTAEQLAVLADEFIKLKIDTADVQLAYCQQYLNNLLGRKMTGTVILEELDKVELLEQNFDSFRNKLKYPFLESLIKKYESDPMCGVIGEYLLNNYVNGISVLNYFARGVLDDNKVQIEEIKKSYDLANEILKKWPSYRHIDNVKQIKELLEKPRLSFSGQSTYYAGDPVEVTMKHKNLQALKKEMVLTLYKVSNDKEERVKDYKLKAVSQTTYLPEAMAYDLGQLDTGNYLLKSDSIDDSAASLSFYVTRLGVFTRASSKDTYNIYVVDRKTGNPLEGVDVSLYRGNHKQQESLTGELIASSKTTDLGYTVFENLEELNDYSTDFYYVVKQGEDRCVSRVVGSYVYRNDYGEVDKDESQLSILLDRNIYRPGQTVYYKVIEVGANKRPLANSLIEVTLTDASGNTIAEKELKTNEFGSASGEFILPINGLLGEYDIEVESEEGNIYENFLVEEYKRPTFEVTFDKIEKTYSFGDEVVVKGYARNYSGVNLQGTEVSYTITGSQNSFWRYRGDEVFSTYGEAETNDDGSFEIKFVPESVDYGNGRLFKNNILQYTISASVTDMNNETQKGNLAFYVGDVSMAMHLDLPEKLEKSDAETKLTVKAMNLNGVDIETSGIYKVYSLNKQDSIADEVASGTFTTGEQVELLNSLKQLASGKYRVKLTAKDDKGKEVEESKDVVLFSYQDKKPPIETNEWLVVKNKFFSDNKPAEVFLGVSGKEMNVLYEIHTRDKVLERKRIILNEEAKLFTIPYKQEYGEQIRLALVYMKDGKLYRQSVDIRKEAIKDTSELKISMDVFRDKLKPGQEETWTMTVLNEEEKPANAEVLASMYDASLDQITGEEAQWLLKLPTRGYTWSGSWSGYDYFEYNNYNYRNNVYWWDVDRSKFKNYSFDKLYLYGVYFGRYPHQANQSLRIRGTATLADSAPELSEAVVVAYGSSSKAFTGRVAGLQVSIKDAADLEKGNEVQIRQNFNETAFFYPQLRTNAKGEAQVQFTVPESNTLWRFRALAHDKQMRVDELEKEVVTRKELMVIPNMPRFVREGDKTSISAKISNLSEDAISGKVRIEFFDPLTEKLIDLGISNAEQVFNVEKDASSSTEWMFDIPLDIEMIGCRIVASSELFSDGEQHVLSVLPRRMLVTESMPFDVNESKEVVFEKMRDSKSKTLENYRLTLEYTSNPAWYAVQALPTLSNPVYENAINWMGAYFVNTLGLSIMKQYPQVAKMIEVWKKQGLSKENMTSKLLQNEELKSVLLSETPWVLDAKNEKEQMERLSLLLDMNNASQQASVALQKLKDLQLYSGGWTWYKGMSASRSITQFVLCAFSQLQEIGYLEYEGQVKDMQMKALKFVDEAIAKDFEQLKKNDKEWKKIKRISTSQLEYAFVRTYYRDIPISKEAREAERFYVSVATDNWTSLDIYERSLLIHILLQDGKKEEAAKIVESLREQATVKSDMGMFWANNNSQAFGFGIPVAVHVFMMNALEEAGVNEDEMNQMTHWLIKQKQVQMWESTPGTILAISRILRGGKDILTSSADKTVIKVGKEKISFDKSNAATGYVKQTWSGKDIKSNMSVVDIKKKDKTPSYGALYWQYYEDLDKIESGKSIFTIDKQYYKKTKTDEGDDQLVSITANTPLKVNDKVTVRLVVRVDRDMDFVHIKDMRAACFEPMNTQSQTQWSNDALYYMETRDASTNFYFDHIGKGTYVFEYDVYVNRKGAYSNGITNIQALYAPEYTSHTAGISVLVE